MKWEDEKRFTLRCNCRYDSHHLFCTYWTDDDDWKFVAISMKMNPEYNFFKRLWLGVRYIFGYQSDFGEYDEIILEQDELDEYIEYLKMARAELFGPIVEVKYDNSHD